MGSRATRITARSCCQAAWSRRRCSLTGPCSARPPFRNARRAAARPPARPRRHPRRLGRPHALRRLAAGWHRNRQPARRTAPGRRRQAAAHARPAGVRAARQHAVHARLPRQRENTIYTQLGLDDLPRPAAVGEIAGLTPTPFEHVNPLGTSIFNTDRPAGQLEVVPVAVERRGGGPGGCEVQTVASVASSSVGIDGV